VTSENILDLLMIAYLLSFLLRGVHLIKNAFQLPEREPTQRHSRPIVKRIADPHSVVKNLLKSIVRSATRLDNNDLMFIVLTGLRL
jgi:hypothetical protein